jgi:hypothetical protein
MLPFCYSEWQGSSTASCLRMILLCRVHVAYLHRSNGRPKCSLQVKMRMLM